jgi:hypothetical protein
MRPKSERGFFDERGSPVVKCVDNAGMRKMVIDELLNKPNHKIKSIAEWKARKNAGKL